MLAGVVEPFIKAGVVQVLPLALVAYRGELLVATLVLYPTATNKPSCVLYLIVCIAAGVVEPFIRAGVVQVEPLAEVAYNGAPGESVPRATNNPLELTVTELIVAAEVEPLIKAGVVQVEPLAEVA
jgi:hypothetical protein